MVGGVDRAKADLARGDARKARDRLKGLVDTYPDDLEVRALLAAAYRLDGQPAEAGRWGYLIGPHATDDERRSFEHHNAWTSWSRMTERRLRHLLRCDDLTSIADESGRALLRVLPDKHPSQRGDSMLGALGRRFAALRARSSWRPSAH